MFGPVAILERLESSLDLLAGGARDLPERQRTLRGAISWSHDLLSEDEQAIFRRLAVFVGGWDAEIAQKVVDPTDGLGVPVVDGLEALADKSMVRVQPDRARRATVRSPHACCASSRSSGWTRRASVRTASVATRSRSSTWP